MRIGKGDKIKFWYDRWEILCLWEFCIMRWGGGEYVNGYGILFGE